MKGKGMVNTYSIEVYPAPETVVKRRDTVILDSKALGVAINSAKKAPVYFSHLTLQGSKPGGKSNTPGKDEPGALGTLKELPSAFLISAGPTIGTNAMGRNKAGDPTNRRERGSIGQGDLNLLTKLKQLNSARNMNLTGNLGDLQSENNKEVNLMPRRSQNNSNGASNGKEDERFSSSESDIEKGSEFSMDPRNSPGSRMPNRGKITTKLGADSPMNSGEELRSFSSSNLKSNSFKAQGLGTPNQPRLPSNFSDINTMVLRLLANIAGWSRP